MLSDACRIRAVAALVTVSLSELRLVPNDRPDHAAPRLILLSLFSF